MTSKRLCENGEEQNGIKYTVCDVRGNSQQRIGTGQCSKLETS
jgi:hypothetical protein